MTRLSKTNSEGSTFVSRAYTPPRSSSLLKKRTAFRQRKPRASNEPTDQILHCEKTLSQGNSCANPNKAPPSSDQRKKAIVDKATVRAKAALPPRGASAIPLDKGLLLHVRTSVKYDHSLKSISENGQIVSLHEPNLREPDEAENWPRLMQILQIRIRKHDLGIWTSGCTRCQMH